MPTYQDYYGVQPMPQTLAERGTTLAPPAPIPLYQQRGMIGGIRGGAFAGHSVRPAAAGSAAPPLHPHQSGPIPSTNPTLAPHSMAPPPLGYFTSVWRVFAGAARS